MKQNMDVNIKPGVLLAFGENFLNGVKVPAPTVCSWVALFCVFCTVKYSFNLVKMERQLFLS